MAESMQHLVERTQTVTLTSDSTDSTETQEVAAVRLKLTKPKNDKKVKWKEDTVDNEDMNKKKSKCCCIYKKPRSSLDSSSEDEDTDCDGCRGHVEKKKKTLDAKSESVSDVEMT